MNLVKQYPKTFGLRNPRKKTGSVVTFLYENEQRYALVLDPYHKGKMHALNLELQTETELKDLLTKLDKTDNYDALYNKYFDSKYTKDRAYRTFLTDKVKDLKEVYLKKS